MSLTVSNNSAVATASYYLGKNQHALQMSIKKLASGKKIITPHGDPGTLSVAMRLNAAVSRLAGARNNVQNGMSFMEVQDGMLQTAGRIVNRMTELKGMASQDPMKSQQDIDSYDNE
ncbi:MAG: flagellin, partial [Opitutae bacterium]|nr:flagellin [Opitutae bacterium]